jgi:hypothetical protein
VGIWFYSWIAIGGGLVLTGGLLLRTTKQRS